MAEPKDLAEYNARFAANTKVDGLGLGVKTHVPCPFCAAPGFWCLPIMDVEGAMKKTATCSECKRSARAIFSRALGGVAFSVVQCGGPEQPAWLEPKMRRLPDSGAIK